MTIISGVNFRPKKCWAKVEQKSCEPKTRKNVIFRYTGSRKMSISDVILVVEKKCNMFWNLDMMRSNEKKNRRIYTPATILACLIKISKLCYQLETTANRKIVKRHETFVFTVYGYLL